VFSVASTTTASLALLSTHPSKPVRPHSWALRRRPSPRTLVADLGARCELWAVAVRRQFPYRGSEQVVHDGGSVAAVPAGAGPMEQEARIAQVGCFDGKPYARRQSGLEVTESGCCASMAPSLSCRLFEGMFTKVRFRQRADELVRTKRSIATEAQ